VEPAKPPAIRWFAVVMAILYGFAKLNGSQFTVLDSELARPMGEVSGFWLTWYYFGYSPIYGNLIALCQIGGGLLLAWPRTALLGALVMLPIFVNIVLIDVFYGIAADAMLVAVLIVACLLAVVMPHARRLLDAVLLPARGRARMRAGVLATLVIGAFGFTWYLANYNNIAPTAIDGVWTVVTTAGGAAPRWQTVFFERNRAFWVVFRSAEGKDDWHHFEVDDDGIVRVWQTWLRKGDLLMQGRVGDDGLLRLTSTGDPGAVTLVLRRARPR
jgi:hypothetical protein